MPRTFIRSERKRRDYQTFRVRSPYWTDPYPWLVGSSIEKMVLAELVRRGVWFIFRSQTNDLGGFVKPDWEADFLLPQHKIWIEIQGSYWHSLPGQLENDSLRYAAIEMAGWKPVFWWEFDIHTRLHSLMDEVGVFYNVNQIMEQQARVTYGDSAGLRFRMGSESLVDQLKGLRAALAKRTKPPQFKSRRRRPWERREK